MWFDEGFFSIWNKAVITGIGIKTDYAEHREVCTYQIDSNRNSFDPRELRFDLTKCECGFYVPTGYLSTHLDKAVHYGQILSSIYSNFVRKWRGFYPSHIHKM